MRHVASRKEEVRPGTLAHVMPVYNEEECIADVVASWIGMYEANGVDYKMIVLNDGSKDRTAEALAKFESNPGVCVINKPNSGHGPTILEGYNLAVDFAEWVFQCDSDDEMPAEAFPELWNQREPYAALFGYRAGRQQPFARKLISATSRKAIALLFASGVRDVNTPYRLMRSSYLAELLPRIPADTFAPNILISGYFAKKKVPIKNLPVPHQGRRTGTVSIMKFKLWKVAFLALRQTIGARKWLMND
jgi:glycosyltransferase involved in cell wall biosynthesis